jgi:hypothetical protein
LKELQKDLMYDIKVNATNIIVHNKDNRIVEIYNLKLELVHSIGLEQFYFDSFKLNNYEVALFKRAFAFDDQFIITCYIYTK